MRKAVLFLLILTMTLSLFTGCKSTEEDFDYVVLFGGINDAMESVEVGSCSDSYLSKDFNTSTFAGGLENLIFYTLHYYGDTAAVGYMSCFKTPNYANGRCADMSAYYEVAKQICEKWQIPYFDMYNHEKLNEELIYDTTVYTTDYLHPNPGGYDIIAPYVAEFMRTMTPCPQEILAKCMK
ncbi:MAG: SGNH/GDSL hydrolase family protein [Clostridia bacterium]|nr:SGNH/GDSL hydrolase family protein [Clostridia bacterium]